MGAEMHPFSLPVPLKPNDAFLRYRSGEEERVTGRETGWQKPKKVLRNTLNDRGKQ
ncbi:hypothetical protein [Bacteroides acidifaciens]|uniref:hypothetical protein n=1 Tax=Bacteroides acidifaciens TaxID=85831 RepID=UPI0025746F9F|nr:hypothetical protein [Bacteroides acidifaciens]